MRGGGAPAARGRVQRLVEPLPGRAHAARAGLDDHLGRGGRVVTEPVGRGAEGDHHIAAAQFPGRPAVGRDPGRAAGDRDQRQRRLVPDQHRPRRLQLHPEQERPPGARAVEQAGDGVHRAELRPCPASP